MDVISPLPGMSAYVQVTQALREMVLAMPWESDDLLPPEPALVERFGVSRGTLRRATAELVAEGLLLAERGRGTTVLRHAQLRSMMREKLLSIALPDSRWHLDVVRFVPDFVGSDRARGHLADHPGFTDAATVFIAPDNSVLGMAEQALAAGKRALVPTYGMRRGMVLLEPDRVAAADRAFAATLDGLERFGRAMSSADLRDLGRVDAFLTGGIAFTLDGVHIGSGMAYLDLEWGILASLGLVDALTPVLGAAHQEQVVDIPLASRSFDITMDAVATPDRLIRTGSDRPRPTGIVRSRLTQQQLDEVAYLRDIVTR